MEQNNFFVYYYLLKPHFLKAFVVGAEKNNLNEMVLTFFVLIYLFIHIRVFVHIFLIHVRVVHMLLSTFAMLKSWPYICC